MTKRGCQRGDSWEGFSAGLSFQRGVCMLMVGLDRPL